MWCKGSGEAFSGFRRKDREKISKYTWDSAIGEVMVRDGAVSAVVEKVLRWSGVAPAGPEGVAAAGWWA